MTARGEDLARIESALLATLPVFREFLPGRTPVRHKANGDVVTAADRAVDEILRRCLSREGEGWLSEESADDLARLEKHRVWVIDPLDGTREFVQGIDEWAVSVGLIEDGEPVAGGILNPMRAELFLGAPGEGVRLNGREVTASARRALEGSVALASRSETERGEWEPAPGVPYRVRAVGSVAYKLALVSAGRAEATWTRVPKHEWDVAAGVALVLAAGGEVREWSAARPRFNRRSPLFGGLLACAPGLWEHIRERLGLRSTGET